MTRDLITPPMTPAALATPAVPGLRLRRSLGHGGMGAVFLADDRTAGRTVALKVIAAEYATDPAARGRFEREIEAVSTIRHVNVVRLLRAGEVEGVLYAVFERARGRSLSRTGPQPWPFVAHVGHQLGSAVAAVHAAGWLHRDIKPANVVVGDHGLVTLLDFGLAKRLRERDDVDIPYIAGRDGWTSCGTVVGTRRYLAPEVQRGRRASAASDVYALGLTLQELHDGATDTPAMMTNVIARALADDPRRRPPAAEIATVLARLPGRAAPRPSVRLGDVPTWPVDADARATFDEQRRAG